ncbi:hypothetical protein V2J09_004972 [Rumex salicifolius]
MASKLILATVTEAETKKMYSWWWDNMDTKVKLMIKLIEVDEVSFARRAEMYYKKRPELMKLVEEFYRAFRALAERYDHATGVIKQAHKTMAEAFPSQNPFIEPDDGSFPSPDDSVLAFYESRNVESVFGEEISFDADEKGRMENLVEQNAILEDDRTRLKALDETSKLLMYEKKATLSSQLDIKTENLEKLSARNTCLEDSLLDTNSELEALKKPSKNLEDSCQLLNQDKSILLTQRQALESKLGAAHQRIQELGIKHKELEHRCSATEEERESALNLVENMHNSLVVSSQFEICVLHGVLHDLKETNFSLLNEYEKLFKTSKLSEELILELEYENIDQHKEVKFLSEQVRRLRMGMFQLLNVLNIDLELVCEDSFERDRIILHHILTKLDDTRGFFCKVWDENKKLLIEKSVLETLLGQLKHELSDLKSVIKTLTQEFGIGNDKLSSLQKDVHKLLQSHEHLILRKDEGNHKEELLVAEVVNLRKKLLEMQDACQVLEKEIRGNLEEKRSLIEAVARLDYENNKVERDNSCLVVNGVCLDTLLLIFKSIVLERTEIVNQLACNSCKLRDDNGVLKDKVGTMSSVVDKCQVENMDLKDSLEKFYGELKQVKIENIQLRLEIARKKDQLSQKEMEFSEAVTVNIDQGKQISELSERYEKQLKESEFLRESMQNAAAEVGRILKKEKETDRRMKLLQSELKKSRVEVELWETIAGTFFSELQISSVREALFEEKFSELSQEYECLEGENQAKDLELVQLRENSQINTQLAGHVQALATLRDSIASLESHTTHTGLGNEKDLASLQEPSKTLDDITNFLDIAARIKAVEAKVIEEKKLSKDTSPKALRSRRGSGRLSRHMSSESSESQSSKGHPHHHLMKYIVLDQASEVSSRGKSRRGGYKHKNTTSDDHILELWETMDQAGNIDLTVGRVQKETGPRTSDSFVEKGMDVDRTGPRESNNNRKILDRIASDVQKLTNLEITVQDLQQKVMITESSSPTKGKGIEYVRVKHQLDEAERAIAKLIGLSGRLMKNAEECSPDVPSIVDKTSEIGRKRKVMEQARRCQEKIGRLQMEVQKIQFMLVKLDGGSKTTRSSGARVSERNTRILLKDFLYANSHTPLRRKKGQLCGCILPPTSGD